MNRTLVLLMLAALVVGCNDQTADDSREIFTPGVAGDTTLSDAGGTPVVTPVRSLCSPGTSRCVGENAPFIDRCSSDGQGYERERCEPGEVCRSRRCEPFACEPGTQLCVGNVEAVCDRTGAAVTNAVECEGDTVCEGGRCVDLCEQARRNGSYIGCEYVATRLDNYYRVEFSIESFPYGVVVANSNEFVSATVEVTGAMGGPVRLWPPRFISQFNSPSYFAESRILAADGSQTAIEETPVVVPPGGAAVILFATEVEVARIKSNRPVTAYQFSPYCCNSTFTNDASLLYPVDTWGDSYRMSVFGLPSVGTPYVGLFSNTQQTITVDGTKPMRLERDGRLVDIRGSFQLPANKLTYVRAGEPQTPASPDTEYDPSGNLLQGELPFAAFTGHPCANVPAALLACDHLQEQLPPAETLGRRYLLTPVLRRSELSTFEGVYWQIVADEDATITFDPPLSELDLLGPAHQFTPECQGMTEGGRLTMREGEVCLFGTASAVALESTGDILVAGIITGQQSTGLGGFGANAGDPSLFVLAPAIQFRDSYSFIAPPTYARNYVAVAAPLGEVVLLDGRNVEAEFRSGRQVVELEGRQWEVFVVGIEPGLHQISSEDPFGIMVYAMDDYVSYAFVGGQNLLPKGAQ